MKQVKISIWLWYKLISGLRARGQNIRESGAFLIKSIDRQRVSEIIFYDELDPTVSSSGIIKFNGIGYSKLWSLLQKKNMEVVADIHTHPDSNTNQSYADQTHPMIRLKGHIALIAPNFAMNKWLSPNKCSAYLYEGSFKWKKLTNNVPLKITIL